MMVPFTDEDRSAGRKIMEAQLTGAARVRRQLKAGRPRKIKNEQLPTMAALLRVVQEADRARTLMQKYGCDPTHIHLALIYCTPEKPGREDAVGYKWLPSPGDTGRFFDFFDARAKDTPVFYLGVLWFQEDPEAREKNQPWQVAWVTQFVAGPEAEKRQSAARDAFVCSGFSLRDIEL
jgi:hypothetical protein